MPSDCPLEHIEWLVREGRQILQDYPLTASGVVAKTALKNWQTVILEQQLTLRWRSRKRFPDPELWLWTDRSLSQASDYWSAKYKAGLFPVGARVLDACCGAGSDLVALAARGEVYGLDLNSSLAILAKDNCREHGYSVEVTACSLPEAWTDVASDWISIDPDRRPGGAKTTRSDLFSPTLEEVLGMAECCQGGIVKLAPSTQIDAELSSRVDGSAERLWVGSQGECRQQLLLLGNLRQGLRRRAVLCQPTLDVETSQELSVQEFTGDPDSHVQPTNRCSTFLFDLHNTLHAANLQAAWATTHGLRCLTDQHGYFTGDQLLHSPWLQAFEVLEVLPWDDRRVRKWLHGYQAGSVEVKCRSVKIDANAYQKQYSRPAGKPVTLLVTRLGDRVRAIATQRCSLALQAE